MMKDELKIVSRPARRALGPAATHSSFSSFIIHHSSFSSFRPGFTLVELMMSLVIIGLLVSLLGVAVNFALKRAKQVQVSAEISNLDVAMQSYSTQFGGEYPPCMAIPAYTSALPTTNRYDQFNRAIRKRFPRYALGYVAGWSTNANSNPTDIGSYLYNNWHVRNINDPTGSVSNAIALNIDTLDAAEALVFWLAGPPTPVDYTINPPQFLSPTALWGFCANATTPFAPKGSRTAALFSFDESRLVDVDGDGWPEYSPPGTANKSVTPAHANGSTNFVPPYVYFDPSSYVYYRTNGSGTPIYAQPYFACYPSFNQPPPHALPGLPIPQGPNISAMAGTPMGEFGFAMPYLTNAAPPTSGPYNYTFWNPKKFQIISAGPDNDYGGSVYEPPPFLSSSADGGSAGGGSSGGGRPYAPLLPQMAKQGVTYPSGQPLLGSAILLVDELDNLTNFTDSKLEDYTPQ
jgi:prepilin-type N-terminal cleavage/methylation domain-containing protein